MVLALKFKLSFCNTLSPKVQKFNSYLLAKDVFNSSIFSRKSALSLFGIEDELSIATTMIGFSTLDETDLIKGESNKNEMIETTIALKQNRTTFNEEDSSATFKLRQ